MLKTTDFGHENGDGGTLSYITYIADGEEVIIPAAGYRNTARDLKNIDVSLFPNKILININSK
jgi:hypothetical protein